jgi:RNA polymerase sigma-70 factor (ECF subfamily)
MPADEESSNEALMSAVRDGDHAAFRELFDRHAPRVFRLAQRMLRSAADAEDATQDAFLAAFRNAHTYRAGRPVLPWLLRIARNAALAIRGRRSADEEARRAARSGRARPEPSPSAEGLAEAAEQASIVREAVDGLPEAMRDVVVLMRLEGLSAREVAEVLDVTERTVWNRLRRALERLSREL